MDPLSATASIVGIIGFGIQIAQILQKQVDAISTAAERVEQIAIEIRATATGLKELRRLLIADDQDFANRVFNDAGRAELDHIVWRCDTVFRNLTQKVAKAGHRALSAVDEYQRKVEKEHRQTSRVDDFEAKLDIELSNLDHLMWSWRLPKVKQDLADLDRLKLSLVLILTVANLAKMKKKQENGKGDQGDTSSERWDGSEDETLVEEEIFKQDSELREAENEFVRLFPDSLNVEPPLQPEYGAAQLLLQNWPYSPSGDGYSTVADLSASGVIFEGFAFNLKALDSQVVKMPLNMQTIQSHALQKPKWRRRNPAVAWDRFARLPHEQQEMLLQFIEDLGRGECCLHSGMSPRELALISLHCTHRRSLRLWEALRRVIKSDLRDTRKSTLFIVTGRLGRSGGSPPPIHYAAYERPPERDRPRYESHNDHDDYYDYEGWEGNSHGSHNHERWMPGSWARDRGYSRPSSIRDREMEKTKRKPAKPAFTERKVEQELPEERDEEIAFAGERREKKRREEETMRKGLKEEVKLELAAENKNDILGEPTALKKGVLGPKPATNKGDRKGPIDAAAPPRHTATFQAEGDIPQEAKSKTRGILIALGLRSNADRKSQASQLSKHEKKSYRARVDVMRSKNNDRRNKTGPHEISNVIPRYDSLPTRRQHTPIIITYSVDGLPPTSKNKVAVAEYYLKKWTTAFGDNWWKVRRRSRDRVYRNTDITFEPDKRDKQRPRARERARNREADEIVIQSHPSVRSAERYRSVYRDQRRNKSRSISRSSPRSNPRSSPRNRQQSQRQRVPESSLVKYDPSISRRNQRPFDEDLHSHDPAPGRGSPSESAEGRDGRNEPSTKANDTSDAGSRHDRAQQPSGRTSSAETSDYSTYGIRGRRRGETINSPIRRKSQEINERRGGRENRKDRESREDRESQEYRFDESPRGARDRETFQDNNERKSTGQGSDQGSDQGTRLEVPPSDNRAYAESVSDDESRTNRRRSRSRRSESFRDEVPAVDSIEGEDQLRERERERTSREALRQAAWAGYWRPPRSDSNESEEKPGRKPWWIGD